MGKESLNHCLLYLTYPQIYSGVTVTVLCDVIVNNSVVWVTLAKKGTYDGYTMIGAIVDCPIYPVFVSAPQHAGDGRIFTRIWNYSNEQNTISCTFYIYFVKNGAIKDF